MKTKNNYFKTGLLALALIFSAPLLAQIYPTAPTAPIDLPADLNGGTVTSDGTTGTFAADPGTVLFYRPTTGYTDASPAGSVLNLSASLTDAAGNTFANHAWYKVTYAGTPATEIETQITTGVSSTPGGNTNDLLRAENLVPGYNRFRVRGEMGDATLTCPSVEYQDIIVFVLPPLDVVPTVDGTTLVYCENDVPAGIDKIELSATIDANYTGNNSTYAKPVAANFSLTYQWYAVPATLPSTPIAIGGNAATLDLSTLTTPLTPDTYTFYLNVEYDSDIRAKGSRTYVTYGGDATATNGAAGTVTVTATPGNPTISVDSVED